jgi:hydrogenase maturation protein HypF
VTAAVDHRVAVRFGVTGEVQGVGFRPFVHRLASQCRVVGRVANTFEGVAIQVEGRPEDVRRFQERLKADAPGGTREIAVRKEVAPFVGFDSFTIEESEAGGGLGIRIPRDLAVCSDCRREVFAFSNRRFRYPFTNCTACGPRYSILKWMPYDRPATTMRRFSLCGKCEAEYQSPADRRFHAQPNACGDCGPNVQLWDRDGRPIAEQSQAISTAVDLLRRGVIVAVKGLGGFQLLVRADDDEAIDRLRRLKRRPTKPFAVMAPTISAAERFARFDADELRLLTSPQNPIVLARKIPGSLPESVAPNLHCVGVFLPSTPLHELLLEEFGSPVVATSGNLGEEPIVIDEREAVLRIGGVADAFLVHDRPILRRLDDSVVQIVDGGPSALRSARGCSPLPLPTLEDFNGPPILAVGGHQKAALALSNGSQSVLAQHIGDMDGHFTRLAFEATVADLESLYRCRPEVVACDLHPDYFTTRWAEQSGRRVVRVQHHHAHAAAAQIEHDLTDRPVTAIVWDGTGFGIDGTLWGGEFLQVQSARFQRTASLLPIPLPGGESAILHPNRIAFGMLQLLSGTEAVKPPWLDRLGISSKEAQSLTTMMQRRLNVVWSSGVGRLFDAVAALVLPTIDVTFEGEAAMRLEAAADQHVDGGYSIPLRESNDFGVGDPAVLRGDWRPMLAELLSDLANDVDTGTIAARFHHGLGRWGVSTACLASDRPVVLAGGCFQNRLLTERLAAGLRSAGRQCFTPGLIPCNDGGLAAGQLAVAMAQLKSETSRSKGEG